VRGRPLTSSGSSRASRGRGIANRGSIVALLTSISLWLSAGTVAVIAAIHTVSPRSLPSGFSGAAAVAVAAAKNSEASPRRIVAALATLLVWLPFLPGQLPARSCWQGPTEAYCLVDRDRGRHCVRLRRGPSFFANPDRAPWIAGAMVAGAALAAFSQVRGVILLAATSRTILQRRRAS
jgi:hypothetical protein